MAKAKNGGADQSAPEMTNEGQQNFLEWLQSNPPTEEILEQLDTLRAVMGLNLDKNAGFDRDPATGHHRGVILQGFELLPPDVQEQFRKMQAANEYLYNFAIETAVGKFTTRDSGQSFYNASPVLKQMLSGEQGKAEIVLGTNNETGEAAIFTLLSGYITPYEKEVIECVSKFKLDGQLTDKGKIWFTVGQLYRAMRHGAGTQSPTKEQRAALMDALTELSKPERKLTFKLNDYLKTWGGFETNGGRVRLIGFDELFGKIRGQEDILIILDDTPIICAVAENLHMWEPIPQAVKAIKQERYTLTYIAADGKEKNRSFATNEARQKFCKKTGLTGKDIIAHDVQAKAWALSENRIALRTVLLSFVYSYLRARESGARISNKLSYAQIFERCGVSENREEQKRAKEYIAIILNHFVKTVDGLNSWTEYTNKGSTKPDGVQISIGSALIEGA